MTSTGRGVASRTEGVPLWAPERKSRSQRGITGNTVEERLNETIKLLLTRTGQRHSDIAQILGVSQSSMSARLRGESSWKLDQIPPIADHFGLTVGELLAGYAAIPSDRLPPAAKSSGQTRI